MSTVVPDFEDTKWLRAHRVEWGDSKRRQGEFFDRAFASRRAAEKLFGFSSTRSHQLANGEGYITYSHLRAMAASGRDANALVLIAGALEEVERVTGKKSFRDLVESVSARMLRRTKASAARSIHEHQSVARLALLAESDPDDLATSFHAGAAVRSLKLFAEAGREELGELFAAVVDATVLAEKMEKIFDKAAR